MEMTERQGFGPTGRVRDQVAPSNASRTSRPLREFHRGVRKVGDLTIIFQSKDTIYLVDADHQTIIHRWWKVRKSWNSWRVMVKSFKTRKHLTYGQALGIAITHGFGAESARSVPNIDNYDVIDWSDYEKVD